ncbi:protein kinase [Streptomyces laurentii]|uniref:protein kinase domain-containing protein n=1 Tax=Streptomyces laurentii TaxID=39478 RepID=UPI0036972BC2
MNVVFPLQVEPGYRVGRWVVEDPLGAGAFASVYAARPAVEPEPGPSGATPVDAVALKFLPTGTCTPRGLRHLKDLVEREVALLSRLQAPRLIRLYETLTVDDPSNPELDGATVLVLERAAHSLHSLLTEADPGARIDAGPGILAEVSEGLHQLHDAGWVHGDLKPGNVLLMPDGGVRLGDFSTAGELEGTHAYGTGFGTPDYTPPELLWSEMGARGTRVRPSSDIWAFGVLAHLVLTGTHLFPGGTPAARRDAAVHYARGMDTLRLSPTIPEAWRAIIEDCLRRTHEERAALDSTALLHRVREAVQGRTPPRKRPAPARHQLWTRVVAAVVFTGGPLVASLSWWQGTAEAVGYSRCEAGYVCFFSERDGQGDMCVWKTDAPEWYSGPYNRNSRNTLDTCSWSDGQPPASVWNNSTPDAQGYDEVEVYAATDYRYLMTCVSQRERGNLALPYSPYSHQWVTSCAPYDYSVLDSIFAPAP